MSHSRASACASFSTFGVVAASSSDVTAGQLDPKTGMTAENNSGSAQNARMATPLDENNVGFKWKAQYTNLQIKCKWAEGGKMPESTGLFASAIRARPAPPSPRCRPNGK